MTLVVLIMYFCDFNSVVSWFKCVFMLFNSVLYYTRDYIVLYNMSK